MAKPSPDVPAMSASQKVGLTVVLLLVLLGGLAPVAFDLDPYTISSQLRAEPGVSKGSGPLLGTDDLGRDVFSRLAYGARSSVSIGVFVVTVSGALGIFLGLMAGVNGGWIDTVVMQVIDVVMTVPSILLAIVVASLLGSGLATAMAAATTVALPGFVRIVRSVAALEMKKQYIQAARTGGSSTFQILWDEVLPNCWAPIIAQATLGFGDAILNVAALGFLGLGAKPPIAEWGAMLADARPFIESNPHLMVLPGVCLMTTVFGFSLLGDTLQQQLNPKGGSRR